MLCDIVLAAEDASFQDAGHFGGGLVPGDGVHVIYPLLLGLNRGRYLLLTDQTILAKEAHTLGLVNEVLPARRAARAGLGARRATGAAAGAPAPLQP